MQRGMRNLAMIFGALADPTRLEMLALLLRHRELCVCDFVGALCISQSKASRHLRYMWNARLLEDRRDGLWVHYRIHPELDSERRTILKAVERVMGKRDLGELDGKLQAWLERKGCGPGCSAATPARKPARAQARARA